MLYNKFLEHEVPGFYIPITQDGCGIAVPKGGPAHTVETARNHRYLLKTLPPLGTRDTGLLLFLAKCTRPAIEFEDIVIHSSQDEIHRPGKSKQKAIDFTFYEKLNGGSLSSIGASGAGGGAGAGAGRQTDQCAELIYKWWAKGMLEINTSLFLKPSAFLKDAQLDMLDGGGNPIWSYLLYDTWPVSISPSDLDYSNSEISTISVKLQYGRCVEEAGKV